MLSWEVGSGAGSRITMANSKLTGRDAGRAVGDDNEERPRGCAADARQQQDKSTSGMRPHEKVRVRVRHAGSSAQRTIATKIAQLRVRDMMLRPGLEVRTLSGILGHRYPKGRVEGCSTSVPSNDNRF